MLNEPVAVRQRLAPLGTPLTEETFRKIPLGFVGPSILRWDRDAATQLAFNGTARGWDTRVGAASWRKNPIPHIVNQWDEGGPAFEPPCQVRRCSPCPDEYVATSMRLCRRHVNNTK